MCQGWTYLFQGYSMYWIRYGSCSHFTNTHSQAADELSLAPHCDSITRQAASSSYTAYTCGMCPFQANSTVGFDLSDRLLHYNFIPHNICPSPSEECNDDATS